MIKKNGGIFGRNPTFRNVVIEGLLNILGGFSSGGFTLNSSGIYAVTGSEGDKRLARHEGVHWQQYEKMGAVMFYLTYLYQMVRYGYCDAPMEKRQGMLNDLLELFALIVLILVAL